MVLEILFWLLCEKLIRRGKSLDRKNMMIVGVRWLVGEMMKNSLS